MTPQQITLVRHGFAQLVPQAQAFGEAFYERLFAADPTLRALFRRPMAAQSELLMRMMGAAVRLLDEPQTLVPVLAQLGARHAGYGVREHHYRTVGRALMATLDAAMGPGFDDTQRQAWAEMLALASRTMIEAAREAQPA